MIELTAHERGTILMVRAQPNACKNGILGERAGALRVAVTVAPEQDKANAAIAEILAEALGCRASSLEMIAGKTARDKRFLILDQTPEMIGSRLQQASEEGHGKTRKEHGKEKD